MTSTYLVDMEVKNKVNKVVEFYNFVCNEVNNITALRIPGEIFAMKRRFFSFNLGFRILSRGCKTEAVLLP